MKKKTILTFLFLTFLMSVAFAQKNQSEFSSKLLPMVGKKVTVTLKDGEVVEGTLWDYEAEFIMLKIKKSLIYSQSVKYNIDELDFLKDENGIKVSFTNDTKPTAIFFSMDDAQSEEPYDEDYNLTQEPKGENGLQITTVTKEKPATTTTKAKPEIPEKTEIKKTYRTRTAKPNPPKKTPNIGKKETRKENSTHIKKTRSVAIAATRPQKDIPQKIVTKKQAKPGSSTASAKPVTRQPEKIREVKESPVIASSEGKEVRVLKYQLLILFVVVGILALVMLAAKAIGLKGSTYGKHTLFPSKIIKLEGNFGIIDQGSQDGVKIDDIIRFYRKDGQKIEYRGQVHVKKVGEHESAVEILKIQKGEKLEIGDVGFRDHNILATGMKKLRVVTSILLKLLGKTIINTAQNIEIKEKEPDIALDAENTTKPKVKVVKSSPKKSRPQKTPGQSTKTTKNGKTVDFSVQNN